VDAGLDTRAASASTGVAGRLRERDPAALRPFLVSWAGAVVRYCRTVCEPELVTEAVEVTFADFFAKVDSHPIGDAHLETALMRSTRLTAAEAARIDWDDAGPPEGDPAGRFDCALTPPFLAGSPSTPASLPALTRMDEHVPVCRRCQASTRRFRAAERAFPESKGVGVREEVIEELLRQLVLEDGSGLSASEPEEPEPEPGEYEPADPEPAKAERESEAAEPWARADLAVGGFRVVAIGEEDPDGVVLCTAVDEDAQEVALRLAPADAAPEFRARFLSDARLLAGVTHSSLPPVLAVGEAPDGAYAVTRELRSRSLVSVIEMGLPVKQVIQMLGETAGAIDAVHRAGLLHRQLRPANIVVGTWLVVRPLVVNFALGRPPEVVLGEGQAPYLSPEEAHGGSAGPASDRYALACLLFEFLTGHPPFGSMKDTALDGHLAGRPPRASEAGPDLPRALDAIFERALSKSPGDRFSTATELVSETSAVLFGPAIQSPAVSLRTDDDPADAVEVDEARTAGFEDEPEQPEGNPEGRWPEGSDEAAEYERSGNPIPATPAGATATAPESHQGQITDEMEAVTSANWEGPPPLPPFESSVRPSRRPPRKGLLAAGAVAVVVAIVATVGILGRGSSDEKQDASESPSEPSEASPPRPADPRPVASVPIALSQARATDYDPNGRNGEQPDSVGALVDGNVRTEWQTDLYPTGAFGDGVGAYISLPRPERPKEIEIRTTSAGWDVEIYGAVTNPPPTVPAPGWTKLGTRSDMRGVQRLRLAKRSQPVRHALVWITRLPPEGRVSIAEVRIFR
jgi:serine/threonine protein kinase